MKFNDLLKTKKITLYKLSKESGVPKTTLFDISSGKTKLIDSTGRNLLKIAKCLGISIEELLSLEQEEYNQAFERNVPPFLLEDIKSVKKAIKEKSSVVDCYLDQLNSTINACELKQTISKDQANYLRKKYLSM